MELVDDLPLVRSDYAQLQIVNMSFVLKGVDRVIDGPKESADEMERGEPECMRVLAKNGGFDSTTVDRFARSFEAIAKSNQEKGAKILARAPFEPFKDGSTENP